MRRVATLLLALGLGTAVGCSSPSGPGAAAQPGIDTAARRSAARAAEQLIGTPYRRRGNTPSGFDCSGLVVYSFAEAGVRGLPRSASSLEQLARPVRLGELEPGDLLFFRLGGAKTSHVAIYVGDRTFVHAPSPGKRVERVGFDHVYWSGQLGRAGRLGR